MGITEDERIQILTGKKGPVTAKSFRLSAEACRILKEEAARLELDETKTIEMLLREIRELRKRRK